MAFSLDQFFAPLHTVGSGGSGASSAAAGGVDNDRLDYSTPQPHDDPDTWDTVWVAEMPLPPIGTGQAKIKVGPSVKLDPKMKAGAAAPRVTQTGGEPTKGTITVRFVSEALPAMERTIATLFPGSGPFPVRHPKARWGKLDHLMIEKWDDAPDPDQFGVFTWTLNYMGINMPAQTGAGGLLTPGVITQRILELEKNRAATLAEMAKDPAKQTDSKLIKRLEAIEETRTELTQQLNEMSRPDATVKTPKQSAAGAKPGDAVSGSGTVAGAQNPAETSRATAQEAASEGAEP